MKRTYRKLKETYCYTHENNISIYIKIDYYNNQIDIVEPTGNPGHFKKKEFVFVGRGVEYMNSWVNILEATQEAVKDAKKRYEEELEVTSRFRVNDIIKFNKS